jgi:cytochrome c oxidase subunit 4
MSEVSQAVASGVHRIDDRASSNQDPHGEFHIPMSTYVMVFAALMVGLVVTVIAAFINLGPFNMPVAMLIATVKALLVILYFMHVKFASRLTKVFVAASFLWLAILFIMTFGDYVSRDWMPNSRGWDENPVKIDYDDGMQRMGHGDGAPAEFRSEPEHAAPAGATHGTSHESAAGQRGSG